MQQTANDVDQVKVVTQQTAADVNQMNVVVQETATDVDQVKRLSSYLITADLWSLNHPFRETITGEHSRMAFLAGPIDEPQYRMWYSSQENSNLVFSRQHLSGVEVNGFASLDPRKTFAPSSFQLDSF